MTFGWFGGTNTARNIWHNKNEINNSDIYAIIKVTNYQPVPLCFPSLLLRRPPPLVCLCFELEIP